MADLPDHPDLRRLMQLVAEKSNGALTPAGHQELQAILAASEQARVMYWEALAIHTDLEWELAGKEGCDEALANLLMDVGDSHAKTSRNRRLTTFAVLGGSALAACLLGVLLVGHWFWQPGFWQSGAPYQADAVAESGHGLAQERPVLGRLTPLIVGSSWSFGRPGDRNTEDFHLGDTVWIDHGAIEMRLADDTVALLQAPVMMQLVSLDRVRVLRGRIKVDVPKGSEGFTVETHSAEVIDLGTTFSVEVGDEGTDLVVFQGEVDLNVANRHVLDHDAAGHDVAGRAVGEKHPPVLTTNRLRQGEAVRVEIDGTLSRIVNVRGTDWAPLQSAATRPPLIESVSDNIARDDVFSFYEIVAGGMDEDQPSYVDRPHEWNGVTSAGMPPYLIGGDYVKTFNNDKVTKELRIDVTLNRPAILYVLLDKRAVPPEWLTRSFEDTGDEIGSDQTPFDVWKGRPSGELRIDVGPGNSIDRPYSIWKRVVENAGVVSLGANGLPARSEKPLDINAELCMYGIVAVPLDAD